MEVHKTNISARHLDHLSGKWVLAGVSSSTKHLVVLFLKVLSVYFSLRVLFNLYNYKSFDQPDLKNMISIYGWGLRMDVVIVFITNIIFILGFYSLYLYLPRKIIRNLLILIFLVCNSISIALNVIDVGYFDFNARRSTIDLLYVFSDSIQSFGGIFKHYWILLLCYGLAVYLFTRWTFKLFNHPIDKKFSLSGVVLKIFLLIIVYLCFRVDDKKLITSTSPLIDIEPKYLALSQNSSFTFLYSFFRRQKQIEFKKYMAESDAAKLYPVIHGIPIDSPLHKKNVVIFILESFAKDYLTDGSKARAHTPFLDSILRKSTYFTNAYSQERSSNKGIVSILASLPPVTDEPFYHSIYAGAYKRGIGHIFNDNGYNTNFFYGTEYDHFGFKKCMSMIGVKNYYCRNDFDNPKFYDGSLGLYDEPWLQFMAKKLNNISPPFLAINFTISSHWPFNLPENFLKRTDIQDEGLAQKSVSYADYALRNFFNSIKTHPWFNNSIFVFCADHWFFPNNEFDAKVDDIIKGYEIPIFIYEPSKSIGKKINTVSSQLDLLPTIYSMTGIKDSFTSFGKNLFDTSGKHFSMNHLYQNGLFQLFDDEYILGFDINTDKSKYLYDYRIDSLKKNNLLFDLKYATHTKELETHLKAMLQQFNNSILQNKLTN